MTFLASCKFLRSPSNFREYKCPPKLPLMNTLDNPSEFFLWRICEVSRYIILIEYDFFKGMPGYSTGMTTDLITIGRNIANAIHIVNSRNIFIRKSLTFSIVERCGRLLLGFVKNLFFNTNLRHLTMRKWANCTHEWPHFMRILWTLMNLEDNPDISGNLM